MTPKVTAMRSKYQKWIIYLVLASLPFGLWLNYKELVSPGFCPPYPVLGIPTCFVMAFYFAFILVSQFVKYRPISNLLFQVGSIAGLATAIWFSVNHWQGNVQCPILLGIPICYAAFVDFLVLVILNQVRCIDEQHCSTA
jgi:hypothetical protein